MARRRFFVDEIRGGSATLTGEEARHLTRVLRVETGQVFEITDNQAAYLAEIEQARGERVQFRVLEPIASTAPPARVTLCAALIKFDRFEWIVEKATELGVERLLPVETGRSDKGLFEASRKRSERWNKIARESSQQSRRVRSPEILPSVRFDASLKTEGDYRYFLDETTSPAILSMLPGTRRAEDRVALLLGPEGGWLDRERQAAIEAGWQAVSLGPSILRAETAALAAIAVVMNAWLS